MLSRYLAFVRGVWPVGLLASALAGCAVPMQTVRLGAASGGSPSPTMTVTPTTIPGEGSAVVRVRDPGADSIALESVNGIDRYSVKGAVLAVRIRGSFGTVEPSGTVRYAARERGALFNQVKQPVKITTCRQRDCRTYYHEFTIELPEHNERSVAVTGGVATVFTRRAITGQDRSVLLRQALNNRTWTLQAEVATHGFNARLQGYHNSDERGGALDLSQTFKAPAADAMGYGLAMRLAVRRADWLTNDLGAGTPRGLVYEASVGPSVMLKGLTASSQLGLYTDGHETLQVLSTFVSLNGHLTEIRNPFSIAVEKSFAFSGNAIIPRRRDGTERMTVGFQLTPQTALRLGMHTRRSTWPIEGSAADVQSTESYYSVGVQYTLSW